MIEVQSGSYLGEDDVAEMVLFVNGLMTWNSNRLRYLISTGS